MNRQMVTLFSRAENESLNPKCCFQVWSILDPYCSTAKHSRPKAIPEVSPVTKERTAACLQLMV